MCAAKPNHSIILINRKTGRHTMTFYTYDAFRDYVELHPGKYTVITTTITGDGGYVEDCYNLF